MTLCGLVLSSIFFLELAGKASRDCVVDWPSWPLQNESCHIPRTMGPGVGQGREEPIFTAIVSPFRVSVIARHSLGSTMETWDWRTGQRCVKPTVLLAGSATKTAITLSMK